MPQQSNRLLMELDKHRRQVNREIINPKLPELAIQDLKPVLEMVAHARGDYLAALMSIAEATEGDTPSDDQIGELRQRRETFEELVSAVNALETVIQREYLDVKSARG